MMRNRTIWIADAAYLMKAAPDKFDYMKLKQELEQINNAQIDDSFYLNSTYPNGSEQQESFHAWLKSAPPKGPKMRVKLYTMKTMRARCPDCGCEFDREVQKGVDVGIATLIVKLAAQNRYSRLILSAGDGDFEDAIAFAKENMHKEIWIAGFDGTISADLQSYSDRVIWLENAWEKIKK
jgi:nijmegen breakage syndrome protein 1